MGVALESLSIPVPIFVFTLLFNARGDKSAQMEPKFRSFLLLSGIGESSIPTLEEESVLTMSVFVSLREEHFEKLLPKLKVGEHATLLKLWDTKLTSASREV